jgi:hypothetical protein
MRLPRSTSLGIAFVLVTLLTPAAAAAADLGGAETFLGQNGAIRFTVMEGGAPRSCNEVSFAAIPGDPGHVVGRHNNTCTGPSFSLAVYAIDWNARTLSYDYPLFDTSRGAVAIANGDSVTTAYDASVMSYGGETWVAFECGGTITGAQTASACIGPVGGFGVLDPARTNVVVLGNASLGDGYLYSASVPELLVFKGTPYVYWSAVKMNAQDTSAWASITGRGMQLALTGGHLWNAKTGSWVGSADPANTVEVWGRGASTSDDKVIDLQGVFTDGTDIFMTAGVAGSACAMPFWPPSCYAFEVSKATSPLTAGAIGAGTMLGAGELPSNTHSYSRYIQDPDGRGYILGGYYTNTPGARPLPLSGAPNAAYVMAYPIPPSSPYFGSLGGKLALSSAGTAIANADGRLEAFAVDDGGSLRHAWQATPGGTWSAWAAFPAKPVANPAVQRHADGRLDVFALGPGRAVVHIAQTAAGGAWDASWSSLGGVANGGPVVDRNVDGTLEIFVVGTDGAVYHRREAAGGFSPWASLGGNVVGSPSVHRNADGRLEVFAVGPDGSLQHVSQTTPGGGYGGFASLGGQITDPVVASNVDGRLEVFGIGADGAIVHTWQVAPNGGWATGWASIGGVATSPSVGRHADGTLDVFAVGRDRAIYHARQASPGGSFGSLTSLGGDFHGASVQANADGRLELLAVEFSGAVHHAVETVNGWSAWASLGGEARPYAFVSADDDKPSAAPGPGAVAGPDGSSAANGTANGANGSGDDGTGGGGCGCHVTRANAASWHASVLASVALLVLRRRIRRSAGCPARRRIYRAGS